MRIIHTKGIIENGEVKVKVPQEFTNKEVDVIIIAEKEPDDLAPMEQIAQSKSYDYNSQEKIMDFFKQVQARKVGKKRSR